MSADQVRRSVTGLCACGCGQTPPTAKYTHRGRGWVKGQPVRYVLGHQLRKRPAGEYGDTCRECDNPPTGRLGLCCGCYFRAWRADSFDDVPPPPMTHAELLAEYQWLRDAGETPETAARRLDIHLRTALDMESSLRQAVAS